jgi:hypothetical protein
MNIIPFLDIAIIISVLFNIGAVILTNAMVVKANPTGHAVEANPLQAKLHGWETIKTGLQSSFGFMLHIGIMTILIAFYLIQRQNIAGSETNLFLMAVYTIFIFLLCTLDFSNDLGFYIGKLLFQV